MAIWNAFSWKRIKNIAETMPIYFYVPSAYVIILALSIPLEFMANQLNIPDKELSSQMIPENIWIKYFLVVIIAPFLETFISQALPFHFLSLFQFMKKRPWLMMLISGLLFGIVHVFSWQHIFFATVMGILFMGTYIVRAKKGDSFLCTFLVHAFFNLMAVVILQFS